MQVRQHIEYANGGVLNTSMMKAADGGSQAGCALRVAQPAWNVGDQLGIVWSRAAQCALGEAMVGRTRS